ncbi:MAG TPA: bifunctional UDP-sugar hydrolase/5'-nucleotidase [Bryobacteraceae bacterium]|nr:bifunctional UDP-sugar hydrolase/5'-nucleotidase [Bryobacteraceae bacterium]
MMSRTRRCFLLACLLSGLFAAQAAVRSLTILHVNDLHARLLPDPDHRGGFAYLVSAIRQEEKGCRSCLLLNAGDLVQGTPVSTIFQGLPVYEIGNLFHFDVSTLGNHEFDYGWEMVPKFLAKARFPVVSANLTDASGRLIAGRPYLFRKVNGIRVAVIGLVMEDLARLTTPDKMGPWRAQPVIETLRKYVAEVREQSDLIVALAHVNDREAEQILHQVPEVAVVVSGHNHTGLKAAQEIERRVNVRVDGYGRELGRLDLRVNVGERRLESWIWKRIPVNTSAFAPAADMAAQVAHWEAQVSQRVDVPIGESRREIAGPELRSMLEQAMAAEVGADFGFLNAGGVRDKIPQGRLLARHIWNLMPFDDRVMVGKFRGSELPDVVKEGRQIDPNRTYRLAVTDFTAANQGERSQLRAHGMQFPESGPLLRDLLIAWIRKKQVLP